MALTLATNSPIDIISGNLYCNDIYFDSRLFFNATEDYLYYALIRDGIVIANGKLNGYYNLSNYSYRFDFDNYIKINNQSSIEFTTGTTYGTTYLKFDGNNSSNIALLLGTSNVVDANVTAGGFTQLDSGTIMVTYRYEINELIYTYVMNYKFCDKIEGNDILFESSPVYQKNTYLPITVYDGTINGLSKTTGYDYTVYLFLMTGDTFSINAIDGNSQTILNTTVNTQNNKCYNDWYFFNNNGAFDTLHCTGVHNENDTIEKTSFRLNDYKNIYTKISIQKKIVQNTGLSLTASQIRTLISSPFVYRIIGTMAKEYEITTNTFVGYNGLKLGERNLEIIFTDPKSYQRKTNYTSTFFD